MISACATQPAPVEPSESLSGQSASEFLRRKYGNNVTVPPSGPQVIKGTAKGRSNVPTIVSSRWEPYSRPPTAGTSNGSTRPTVMSNGSTRPAAVSNGSTAVSNGSTRPTANRPTNEVAQANGFPPADYTRHSAFTPYVSPNGGKSLPPYSGSLRPVPHPVMYACPKCGQPFDDPLRLEVHLYFVQCRT